MPLYLRIALPIAGLILCVFAVRADQLLPNTMYRALPTLPIRRPTLPNKPPKVRKSRE
jgi:hypothetical protein